MNICHNCKQEFDYETLYSRNSGKQIFCDEFCITAYINKKRKKPQMKNKAIERCECGHAKFEGEKCQGCLIQKCKPFKQEYKNCHACGYKMKRGLSKCWACETVQM